MIPMLIMGVCQGVFEWLPVSSEGAIATIYSFVFEKSYQESIQFALWLHLGTVPSAAIVFRKLLWRLGLELTNSNRKYSSKLKFLVTSTLISAPIGFGLFIGIDELTQVAGSLFMVFVGVAMLVTGLVQFRHRVFNSRPVTELNLVDSVMAGIAQGISVIPGFSRSGMTIAVLTFRGIDRKEVLALSYIMSMPASLGAALWIGITQGFSWSAGALLSALIAFVVGLFAIKLLIAVSDKVNLSLFIIVMGFIIIAGGILTNV
ncbi:MAG: undecaprenyl-diphosphatase [Chloroflexi bacterium]|jgi:undecaprenyl-diphosphatase|nr:MAG: undecaprenyl-diphosphatase [Chloroflexota bacterium]